jgi:hypothetical protein
VCVGGGGGDQWGRRHRLGGSIAVSRRLGLLAGLVGWLLSSGEERNFLFHPRLPAQTIPLSVVALRNGISALCCCFLQPPSTLSVLFTPSTGMQVI